MDLDDGVTPAEYQRVQGCRAQLLEAYQRAVEEYIARCALDEADMFPYRGALSGDYYLEGRERYGRLDGPLSVSVSIMARCLGKRPARWGDEPRDYLGIDVVLLFDPAAGTFSTFYTGGSVI